MHYILSHLELVWAFVRGRDEALYSIDATPRGVAMSFLAILIVEPISFLYARLFGFFDRILLFRDGGLPYYLLQIFLDWGLAPLIFLLFCTVFGFRDRFVPLIVSYNWLSVIVLVITLLPGALISTQSLGMDISVLLVLAVYGFSVWVAFRLYRFVLGCPTSQALGLAILMLVLGVSSAHLLQNVIPEQVLASSGN